jgi:hypothetical protein
MRCNPKRAYRISSRYWHKTCSIIKEIFGKKKKEEYGLDGM